MRRSFVDSLLPSSTFFSPPRFLFLIAPKTGSCISLSAAKRFLTLLRPRLLENGSLFHPFHSTAELSPSPAGVNVNLVSFMLMFFPPPPSVFPESSALAPLPVFGLRNRNFLECLLHSVVCAPSPLPFLTRCKNYLPSVIVVFNVASPPLYLLRSLGAGNLPLSGRVLAADAIFF